MELSLSSEFEIEEVSKPTGEIVQQRVIKDKRASKKSNTKKEQITPSNEKRVQATNDDSIVSKRSSSRAAYFEDDFLKFFVPKLAKRSPFINRGYFIRCHAIRYSVQTFLDSFANYSQSQKGPAPQVNIINVGAGFDTTFFHFASKAKFPPQCKYYELDFADVVLRKKDIILENNEFKSLLKNISEEENTGIISDQYILIDVDLRDLESVERKLKEIGKIDENNITLLIAECVLTYIPPENSSNIIKWAAKFFPVCEFVTYEQIIPNDGFGQVMCSNLANRSSPLLGIAYFPNVISQRERYVSLGFQQTRIMDINSYYQSLPTEEVQRIEALEEFDEEEDWKIKCSHYFLAWAWKDNRNTGVFSSYVPITDLPPPTPTGSESTAKWIQDFPKGKRSLSLRWGHSSNKIDDKIVVFGGYGQSHGLAHSRLNDIIILDLKTLQWKEPHVEGLIPSKRIHHSSSDIYNSRILIFGGREGPNNPLNDCYIFDVAHYKWHSVNQSGDILSKRFRHATCAVANFLYLFGGKAFGRSLNDFYELNLQTFTWSKINAKGTIPTARYSHSLSQVSWTLLLFGGITDANHMCNDLYVFHIQSTTWQKIDTMGDIPSPRFSHAVDVTLDKELIVVGGVSNTANSHLGSASNEIFKLKVENWTWEKLPITIPSKNAAVRHSIHLHQDNFLICIGGGCICFSFGSLFSPTLILSFNGSNPSIEEVSNEGKEEVHSAAPKERTEERVIQVPRISNPTKEQFLNEIYAARKPVIFTNVDMGQCTSLWNPGYLIEKFGDKETSVHVCKSQRMDFINKNFTFHTMKMRNLVNRMYNLEENAIKDERYYLRSMGVNPRKDVSDIWDSFPEISADFKVPEFVPMAHKTHKSYFSSAFRMSSSDCQMWTHFDVMDNILCEIKGNKKVVLWPPSDVSYLYVSGSTSHVLDIDNPDLIQFPLFSKAHKIECTLKEGEILFIPAYWFHNVLTVDPCIAVNIFWKHMPDEFYYSKDLYGNRDPVVAMKALEECQQLCNTLSQIPPYYREFYVRKIISTIKSQFS